MPKYSGRIKGFVAGYGTDSGIYDLADVGEYVSTAPPPSPVAEPGQVEFTTPGSYYWTVPAGVTSVSAVAIGGGGGGSASTLASNGISGGGGGGGGLHWKTFSATPGSTWNIVVGAGGTGGTSAGNNNANPGGESYINIAGSPVISATGGAKGVYNSISGRASGGGPLTSEGGNGGNGGQGGSGSDGNTGGGGGGAGGYSGNGGNGASGIDYVSGTGGAGGGGGGSTGANNFTSKVNWGGGGVGIYGQGASGGYTASTYNIAGNPGS